MKQLYTPSIVFFSAFIGLFSYFILPSIVESSGVLYNEMFSSSGTKLSRLNQSAADLKLTNDSLLFLINTIENAVFKSRSLSSFTDSSNQLTPRSGSLADFLSSFAFRGSTLSFEIVSVAKPADISRQKLSKEQSSLLRSLRSQLKVSDQKVYIFSFRASFFSLLSLVNELESNNFVKKIWHISSDVEYNGDEPGLLTSVILELR